MPFLVRTHSLGGKERIQTNLFFVGSSLRHYCILHAFSSGRKPDFAFWLVIKSQQMIERFKDNLKAVISLAFQLIKLFFEHSIM